MWLNKASPEVSFIRLVVNNLCFLYGLGHIRLIGIGIIISEANSIKLDNFRWKDQNASFIGSSKFSNG